MQPENTQTTFRGEGNGDGRTNMNRLFFSLTSICSFQRDSRNYAATHTHTEERRKPRKEND